MTRRMFAMLAAQALVRAERPAPQDERRGQHFRPPKHPPAPLPRFEETKGHLPAPIFDENPLAVKAYWRAWELAFRNFYDPPPGSGFVSQFIDAAFSGNIFLWDTCFMTMFCNYAHSVVPGIGSLDNFYAKQYPDGEICREIGRNTGEDFSQWVNGEGSGLISRWGWRPLPPPKQRRAVAIEYRGRRAPQPQPRLTLDALNHPIVAWAEWESYVLTGDAQRLAAVWEPLVRYHDALEKYLLQGNGLYMTDWASMDNSPRNVYLDGGGAAVDTSSEMVLFARRLSAIAGVLGKKKDAERFRRTGEELGSRINAFMWDREKQFYFDLTLDGRRAPSRTVAAYWSLVAGVASREQAAALVRELDNPATFGRPNRIPTCAASEPLYDPAGGYWRGAVWEPTNTMVLRGLERYGYTTKARDLARAHLRLIWHVFERTNTFYENYSPEAPQPGKPARRDFVGWSGLGPILWFLEYGIGLKADAPRNRISWNLDSVGRTGCERLRFNGQVVSLLAEPDRNGRRAIRVESEGRFKLHVQLGHKGKAFEVRPGRNAFAIGV